MDIGSIITSALISATAATGGVSAGSNQTVVTGDAEASVQVTNVIKAGNNGGTSHTEIIKSVDGNTTKEVIDKDFAPGEPVVVETAVEAVSGKEEAQVKREDQTTEEESISGDDSAVGATSTPAEEVVEKVQTVFEKIADLWSSVVSFFWR